MFLRKLIAFFSVLPTMASASGSNDSVNSQMSPINDKEIVLTAGQHIDISLNNSDKIWTISHAKLASILTQVSTSSSSDKIGVRFHEEDDNIDFGWVDGVSVVVPMRDLLESPPNVDGVKE